MSSSASLNYFSTLGLSYVIALAVLVILFAVLLASDICCRRRNPNLSSATATASVNPDGIILLRIIFVAEDDGDEENLVLGLDQAVINSYPKFAYCRNNGGLGFNATTTCAICLCEYKDSEMLRMVPECRHYFHLCYIDAWLPLNGSFPVCRNSPLPTPLSMPLSEVIPLSQYAYDR